MMLILFWKETAQMSSTAFGLIIGAWFTAIVALASTYIFREQPTTSNMDSYNFYTLAMLVGILYTSVFTELILRAKVINQA
ncbi:MAG: putative transporter [Flavobacteriales bacterium]|jgi:predicted transporter